MPWRTPLAGWTSSRRLLPQWWRTSQPITGTTQPLDALDDRQRTCRTDATAPEAATAGFERLVSLLAGKSKVKSARHRALVAASTMIGAVTMSRVVNDPKLSAEILNAVEKSLITSRRKLP